jgi:tRNA pseudouridine55 synthase
VPEGILLVDKPLGVSSHGVVSVARKALGTKKVGHAGTLDPEASGLLVLGVGVGTKLLTFCVGMDKTYQAVMRLGYATTTDDAEGERIDYPDGNLGAVQESTLDEAMSHFVGRISQVPSTFSAIKVEGKRAYDLARSGQVVELKAREVTVHSLQRGSLTRGDSYLDVELGVECSSGTYIRALARDIGARLGVGGHLVALRRSTVGPFSVVNAVPTTDITADHLISPAAAVAMIMPTVTVSATDRDHLRHGRSVPAIGWPEGQPIAALDEVSGELVAILECSEARSRILMGVPNP